jgi:hypothetical protein
MSRIIKSRRAKVLLGALAAMAIAAAAVAYWTSSGSGTTTATTKAGNGTTFSFGTTNNTPSGLAPGAGAKELTGSVTNTDADTSYKLQTITATITSVTAPNADATHTCTVDDYRLSDLHPAAGDAWVISNTTVTAHNDKAVFSPQDDLAAGADRSFGDLGVELLDQSRNQDGCKGATANIGYAAA